MLSLLQCLQHGLMALLQSFNVLLYNQINNYLCHDLFMRILTEQFESFTDDVGHHAWFDLYLFWCTVMKGRGTIMNNTDRGVKVDWCCVLLLYNIGTHR